MKRKWFFSLVVGLIILGLCFLIVLTNGALTLLGNEELIISHFFSFSVITLTILILGTLFFREMLLRHRLESELSKRLEIQDNLQASLKKSRDISNDKFRFWGNLLHDIRVPINSIVGISKIIELNDKNSLNHKDYMEKIFKASKYLQSLANDALDISCMELGKIKLNLKPFRLSEMLEEIVDLLSPSFEQKKVEFVTDLKNIKYDYVIGDQIKISRVFVNILNNACKFTSVGGRVSFEARQVKEKNIDCAYYEFKFRDTGIGMNPEFLEKVFYPFERDYDYKSGICVEGTGLGMSIAKGIIDLMGGDIKVESKVGEGTLFTVAFPLKLQELNEEYSMMEDLTVWNIGDGLDKLEKEEIDLEQEKLIYQDKHLLLVEDNVLNMEIESEIIGLTGINVETAYNGKEALEKINNSPQDWYDIILMDIRMPLLDGYETTKAIRELKRKDVRDLPIIGVSANVFKEDRLKAKEVGMSGYLFKPIDLNYLCKIFRDSFKDKE